MTLSENIKKSGIVKVIISIIAVLTLCGFAYGIYIFFTGNTLAYFRFQKQVAKLDGKLIEAIACEGSSYQWEVNYSASAYPANFEIGPARLDVRRNLRLVSSGNVILDTKLPSSIVRHRASFPTLDTFVRAYLLNDLAEQMKMWSRPDYQSGKLPIQHWSFLLVPSGVVTAETFDVIAECFTKDYSKINTAFTADVPERSGDRNSNQALGAIILSDGQVRLGEQYTCADRTSLTQGDDWVAKTEDGKVGNVKGVVGMDGVMRPAVSGKEFPGNGSYYSLPRDETSLSQFRELENAVQNQQCFDRRKRDLKDVMKALPERIRIFSAL